MIFQNIFSLEDKVVVVTGGTGVLGSSFVKAIAEAGGKVVVVARNITEEKKQTFHSMSKNILLFKGDVMDRNSLLKIQEEVLREYGKIDGLVNAAGGNVPESIIDHKNDVFDMNIEGLRKALELNVWGTVIPSQIFGAVMAKQNFGSIVNISSVSAKTVLTKVLGYSMGKGALDRYTKWFAVEVANRYGDNIRINSITPGFFFTKQNEKLLTCEDGSLNERSQKIMHNTPFNRFGKPEELNGAVIYLLSDASQFVTGADIFIDGGFTQFSGV